VRVGGKRVTTVDIHAHCVIPAALDILGQENHFDLLDTASLDKRLHAMDAQGIDIV